MENKDEWREIFEIKRSLAAFEHGTKVLGRLHRTHGKTWKYTFAYVVYFTDFSSTY